MKNVAISLAVVIALSVLLIKPYVSSPGYTTREYAEEFYKNAPVCRGFHFVLNKEATYADAPEKSLCFGLLLTK